MNLDPNGWIKLSINLFFFFLYVLKLLYVACHWSAQIEPTTTRSTEMSSALHWNAYLLHFCSRGRETSRRCPGPQHSPRWWGQTQSGCPSSLFASFHPSSLARLELLRSTTKTGRDGEVTSCVEVCCCFFSGFISPPWRSTEYFGVVGEQNIWGHLGLLKRWSTSFTNGYE